METNDVSRREFTVKACLALLSGVAITVTGCGDGPTAPLEEGDVAADISNRHGHSAVVTGAQLSSGQGLVLDIRGNAGHSHKVSLTRNDLASIAAGERVSKDSTTDVLHRHTVTFN